MLTRTALVIALISLFAIPASAQVDWGTLELETGDILIVTDHDLATEDEVFDAYGIALRLAERDIIVDWWIARGKGYEGVDLSVETDDNPDPDTTAADGVVAVREYQAAPFSVRDPDPSTPDYNEGVIATRWFFPTYREVVASRWPGRECA